MGFYQLAKILANSGDSIQYEPNTIEKHICQYRPKKIIIYSNKLDVGTYKEHVMPFVNFMINNKLDNLLELNVFV